MRMLRMDPKQRPAVRRVKIARTLAVFAALALAAPMSAQDPATPAPTITYQTGQGAKISGPIIARRGNDLFVRDETTKEIAVVTLKSDTKISRPSGFLKMDRKRYGDDVLTPGLIIVVKGDGGDHGNLMANSISFHKGPARTAQQIAAGEVDLRAFAESNRDSIAAAKERARDSLAAMKERARDSLAALNTRVSDLDAFDVKYSATVNFASGKSELTQAAKQALDMLVTQGMGLQGYIIEVAGYADTTGSKDFNQRLSTARANAVVQYLAEAHSIPLRRIVNPMGLGTSRPVGDNKTDEGRAQNRRVEVKVLVNRGLRPPTKP